MVKLIDKIDRSAATIRAVGWRPQGLLTIASQNDVPLYHVERFDAVTLTARVPARRVQALLEAAQASGLQVSLSDRRGAYYFFQRMKRRVALWGGIFLSILALTVLSHRVWIVRVIGASDEAQVRAFLTEQGIFSLKTPDPQTLAQALTKNNPDFLWSSLSVNGPVARVFVKEKEQKDFSEDTAELLVARTDCLIRNLIVLSGQGLVKNGQTVREGEALIAPQTIDGVTYAPKGRAIASVYYSASLFVPEKDTRLVLTGRTQETTSFNLFGIALSQQTPHFAFYRTRQEKADMHGLPIAFTRVIFEELRAEETVCDRESAVSEGESALYERLQAFLPAGAAVVSSDTSVQATEEGWEITLTLETIEDVSVKGSVWDL